MSALPEPLPAQEAACRIRAARHLQGLTQQQLSDLAEPLGLGKHDVGRLERGEIAMQATHWLPLAELLDIPHVWFTLEREELLTRIRRSLGAEPDLRARIEEPEETVKRLEGEQTYPGPPGGFGHHAEGSPPSDEDHPQTEPPEEEDQSQGGEG